MNSYLLSLSFLYMGRIADCHENIRFRSPDHEQMKALVAAP
jgi:hypothetical protein